MTTTAKTRTQKSALDSARAAVDKLDHDDLLKLRGDIDLLLQLLDVVAADQHEQNSASVSIGEGKLSGWIEVKRIPSGKGYREYKYLRWRDSDGHKRSKYLGKGGAV